MKEVSDEYIIGLMKDKLQQEEGFRILMQQYQQRLYFHIRRMVNSHEDTDDVLQNVFLKVFKGIQNFKSESELYTWLYRIATNETITFLNKQKKRQSISMDDEQNIYAQKLVAEPDIEANLIQQKLKEAIGKLPEKQRLVFNMRYYEEMTYNQISDVLETSVGGLKASYHHAVKKIETYLRQTDMT